MEEYTVNNFGGKQHKVDQDCSMLFPRAILEVARLRKENYEKNGYSVDNYLNIETKDHVGRAMRHLLLWQAGDAEDGTVEEHLVHAACRILMALEETKFAEVIHHGSTID